MGWSNEWNDKPKWPKNAADLEQTMKDIEQYPIINAATGKPYSEVLREHNQAAEAQMKAEFAIGIDWGKDDKTAICIKQGDNILCMSESVELNIPSGWNTFKANALQIGDLAVVLSTDDPEEHCMVHVPTQTWFDNAVPEYKGDGEGYSIEQLCLWAWKIQNATSLNWKALREYNNSNYKNIDKAMLNAMREYCLSIKVE